MSKFYAFAFSLIFFANLLCSCLTSIAAQDDFLHYYEYHTATLQLPAIHSHALALRSDVRTIRVPADQPTIRQALAVAQSGDTVEVSLGIYREGSLSVPAGVRLVGQGWQGTRIEADGANTVISASTGSLVQGFTITGSGPGFFDAGVWVSQGAVTLRENRITGNSMGVWGWCFNPPACAIQITLDRNIIDHNSSGGVNSNEYPVLILRNNTIGYNDGTGAVLNNAASIAENNIIVANEGDGLVNNAKATVSHNNAWGNRGKDYVGSNTEGILSVDPLIRDATVGDYSLYAASPVIGYGMPPGTDMGAIPFEPSGLSPTSVELEDLGNGTWRLSWTRSVAEGYHVYYGPCTRESTVIVDAGQMAEHYIQIEEGAPEEVGYAAVSAYDASSRESAVQVARGIRAPCPTSPTHLEVGAFPAGRVRLQWKDTSSLETAFQIERALGTISPSAYSMIATVPANTEVYTDTPPMIGETYWYRIRAINDNGPSPYSNESFTATFRDAPNLDERYMLVLINEARADPSAFGYPSIAPVAPLAYNPLLNYAARSHSQAILNSGFQIGHCDVLGRCPTERARAVGFEGGVAENLIQGTTGPAAVESANRAFLASEGHRNNMLLAGFNEAGIGHTYDPKKGGDSYFKGQYTQTFCGRAGVSIPNLPSGIVIPYSGLPGTEFTYIVNYYHSDGHAPIQAFVYIDGNRHTMTLSTGIPANGTYRYGTLLGAAKYEYYFVFSYPGGSARLPQTGSYRGPEITATFLPLVKY